MRHLVILSAFALVPGMPASAQHSGHGGAPPASRAEALPAQTIFQPQESAGEVTLSLAPRWSDGKLIVLLAANTHSVDLAALDLKQAIRLTIGENTIAPSAADSLSGHHARARVVFPLATAPEHFAIEIRGVPDVEVRVLHWPPQQQAAPQPPDGPRASTQ